MDTPSTSFHEWAQVFHAPGDIRFQSVEIRPPREGEVLVNIEACAICGTDFKAWKKGNPRLQPPIVLGHEFCGSICAIGNGVANYQVGQRVTMATTIGCGDCVYCRRGRTNLCRACKAMGFHHHGAMAGRMLIPSEGVRQGHLVPVDDLAAEIAAIAEPTSCVINNYSHVPRDEIASVLIIGLGPLGALHAIVAQALGIGCVVGADPSSPRRQQVESLPFAAVVSPDQIASQVEQRTGGEGFDLVIVTAPVPAAQAEAVRYARKGGYVSLFGSLPVGEHTINLDSRLVHYGELAVFGSSDSTVEHVRQAVRILRDHRDTVRRIITHRLPLSQLTDAMQLIERGEALKIVLTPGVSAQG